MARFLIDECVPDKVGEAIRGWNAAHPDRAIDFVSVGDPPDLPTGSGDPDILRWAEANDCLLLTVDYATMPAHLADHLAAGNHSPGVLSIRPGTPIARIVEELDMIAVAGTPDEFRDCVTHIPL